MNLTYVKKKKYDVYYHYEIMDLVYCLFPFMTIKAFTVFEGIQLMMAFSFCVRFFSPSCA